MTLLDVSYPAWMDAAACTGSEVNFFPQTGETAAAAKAVCLGCPVRVACLEWAVSQRIDDGVFGGVSARDRRWVEPGLEPGAGTRQCPVCLRLFRGTSGLNLHQAKYCGAAQVHGTHGTYGNGCRCGPCKSAHSAYMRKMRRRRARAAS